MGFHYDKSKKRWIARSKMVKGERVYLGAFKSEADAENAYAVHELTRTITSTPELHRVKVDLVSPKELHKDKSWFNRLFGRLFRKSA